MDNSNKISQLKKAIAAQENLRGIVEDSVIDASIDALNSQLTELNKKTGSEEQRKYATILFADVVGSTQLLIDIDPEEHMVFMDTALKQLAEPIEEFGGNVHRFMGDGFMASFGLPLARENDPELAVRAGLKILRIAKQIDEELGKSKGSKEFQVRVGINSGLIVAGGQTEGENTLMGTAVNIAARIESLAPPGGLLVSQQTYQHIRGLFDIENSETIKMKGFDDEILVFLIKEAIPHTFRAKTRGIEGVNTPMVGRQQELSTLQKTYMGIEKDRTSKMVTVIGEAGIGKSRLQNEFEKWLVQSKQRFFVFKGRATIETMDIPNGLMRSLFATQFGILDDDTIEDVRSKILDGLKISGWKNENLEMSAHFIGHLLGYDHNNSPYLQDMLDTPRELFSRGMGLLSEYFRNLASENTIMIFLDDIHWADENSLEIIFRLFNNLSGSPVMILALSRPTLFERRVNWEPSDNHQLLELQPLSAAHCELLVQEALQKLEDLPKRLSDLIIENAEGNPYYLEELINMLIEDRVIDASSQDWYVDWEQLDEVRIPATLSGVLQARLDSLPSEERTVLQQASVVGRIFWDDSIAYIRMKTLDGNSLGLLENLKMLSDRDMVFKKSRSLFSNTQEYSFRHSVLRDATYESVLKRKRSVYHGLVADWLIEQSRYRSSEMKGVIARHLEKAGRSQEALEYICQAAEAATSNYAVNQAEEFYNWALSLVPNEDLNKRFNLLLGRENVLGIKGEITEQNQVLDELKEISVLLNDDAKKAEVLLRKAWLAFWESNFQSFIKFGDDALSISENLENPHLTWRVYHALSWGYMMQDQIDKALKYSDAALPIARKTNNKRGEGNTLSTLGNIYLKQGNYFLALENLQSCQKIFKEINDQEREISTLINLSIVLTYLGKHQIAREHLEKSLKITQERGDTLSTSTALINMSWVLYAMGDCNEAMGFGKEGLKIKRGIGHKDAIAEGLTWLGNSLIELGRTTDAEEAFLEAAEIRQELLANYLLMEIYAGLAKAKMDQSDLTAALSYVDKIISYVEDGNSLLSAWEPFKIYWRSYQVLKAANDPRADAWLSEAYTLLQEQAEKIPKGEFKDSYLKNPPGHHQLIRAYQQDLHNSSIQRETLDKK